MTYKDMWNELIEVVSSMRDEVVAAGLTRETAAMEGVLITAREIERKAAEEAGKKTREEKDK